MSRNTLEEEEYPVRFTVDAHLISVLGEQLITSEKIGILELIKNSYDAGAKKCDVYIEKVPGLESKLIRELDEEVCSLSGPVVTISDDGIGMNKQTLELGWLRAATTFKTNIKETLKIERERALKDGRAEAYDAIYNELKKANGGRFPLGEKGIGRLATHRLGRYLWLRTKRADDPYEWELKIDWDLFDSNGDKPKNITDVPLVLRRQLPTLDYGLENQGTMIRCYGGRDGFEWNEDELKQVGRAISDLKSPYRHPENFNVEFIEVYDLGEELKSPIFRIDPHFSMKAIINNLGIANIEIQFNAPAHLSDIISDQKWNFEEDLRDKEKKYWKNPVSGLYRSPKCGSFEISLDAYYRDIKWLKEDKNEITEYLDVFGGIGLYRDGLAVMPPSMVAHIDALELGIRARKRTSSIAYYNFIGQIEISQKLNNDIRDQTSREGQLKNQQFIDLVKLSKASVLVLEEFYIEKRNELKKLTIKPLRTPTVRNHSRVASNILRKIIQNYQFDNDLLGITEELPDELNDAQEYIGAVSDTLYKVDEHLKIIEDQQKGLVEAAGYGLAIAIAIHELSKSLTNISTIIERATKSGKPFSSGEMEVLARQSKSIDSEIKRLAPLRVTRLEKSKMFNIRQAISEAVSVFQSRIKSEGIELILPDYEVCFQLFARNTACSQVIANLLDNAIYWLSTPSWQGKDKAIRISCDVEKRFLIIEDTGPGVHTTVLENLYEPFVTKKAEGQGLGLYICDFYLRQMKANISYQPIGTGRFRGARFILNFSKVPEE